MVPTSLVLVLAGLGSPGLPADVAQRVRSHVELPTGSCKFGLALNSDGQFTFAAEDAAAARTAHRPLTLRRSRSAPTAPAVEGLTELALLDNFGPPGLTAVLNHAATTACRAHLNVHPNDTGVMVRLAALLDDVDRVDEAERWFRHATRVAPRDWLTWHSLGSHYWGRLGRLLRDYATGSSKGGADSLPQAYFRLLWAMAGGHPEAARWVREAGDCYDWAVLFAPDAVEPISARLVWSLTFGFMLVQGQTDDESRTAAWNLNRWRLAADSARLAELSGHPLAYGLALFTGFDPDVMAQGPLVIQKATSRYWEQATARLERLREDPDPLVRADATRVLVLVRCLAFGDFVEGERRLRDLWTDPGDPVVLSLAHVVYGGTADCTGMIELTERRLRLKDDPYDHFVRAKGQEQNGLVEAAREAAADGLRTHPTDARLVLLRTGLLLKHGTAADLPEVHLRLAGLERVFGKRLVAGGMVAVPELTDEERDQLQLVRLHRAIYLALVRRPYDAVRMAGLAAATCETRADTARKLAADLIPAGASDTPAVPRTEYLSQPASPLPSLPPAPKLEVLERTEYLTPPAKSAVDPR